MQVELFVVLCDSVAKLLWGEWDLVTLRGPTIMKRTSVEVIAHVRQSVLGFKTFIFSKLLLCIYCSSSLCKYFYQV